MCDLLWTIPSRCSSVFFDRSLREFGIPITVVVGERRRNTATSAVVVTVVGTVVVAVTVIVDVTAVVTTTVAAVAATVAEVVLNRTSRPVIHPLVRRPPAVALSSSVFSLYYSPVHPVYH
ncbi:unnamed protein product [Angiostrongylus costaricensis]|uniref:Uncharacterized protein n=1 Tax=Angiostrongylus costaricensis TaxID=334426 RepID=A0A0R3PUV1_ANGCS|nr:unnamed protein product [Angiostrongylus costaricensis]